VTSTSGVVRQRERGDIYRWCCETEREVTSTGGGVETEREVTSTSGVETEREVTSTGGVEIEREVTYAGGVVRQREKGDIYQWC